MSIASLVKRKLAEEADIKGFSNKIMSVTPNTSALENCLSSLLCYFHQKNRIVWSNIRLYTLEKQFSGVTGDEIFCDPGFISCEWPLAADSSEEIQIWGGMKADLLYLNNDEVTIVLIENKIGSRYTSANTQVERYLKYLDKFQIKEKVFILLTSRELTEKDWYLNEIKGSSQIASAVKVYVLYWEDVLDNFK